MRPPTRNPLTRMTPALLMAACLGMASPALAIEALSINPAWVPKNTAPASAVSTIRGIGFLPGATVAFDGVSAATTFVDSRTLTVQAPTSTVGKIARVVVTNPGGANDDLYPFIYTDKNIYVSSTGNDSNNGTSTATPKRTVRAGIDLATSAPTFLIRVTEGRFGDNSLPLPNGAVLAGGYNLAFTQRDPDQFVSVVDSSQFGFNLRSFGLDAKVVVDGLTFMNGLREGLGGAGLEFVGDQVAVSNSVIVGNKASGMGGGIYIEFSTSYSGRTSISKNVILGNRSYGGSGGGITVYPLYTLGSPLEVAITDNYIAGNRSMMSRGGGISVSTNAFYGYNTLNLKVVGNTIVGNSAKAGAGIDLNLSNYSDVLNLLVDNSVVTFNRAAGDGGGVTAAGLGMLAGSLNGTTIASNTAAPGAGAGLTIGPAVTVDPSFVAKDLIVWGNVADDSSGPMSLTYSDVGSGGVSGLGNISVDPRFMKGLRGRFYLSQNDPNSPISPALDAGSDTSSATGNDTLTTAVDGSLDLGILDMGAHFAPAPPNSPDPIVLNRLDPEVGDVSGTDWVLLRGKGFDPGVRVNFGLAEATNTVYIDSSRILAQPGVHTPGYVTVTVTNPDATSDAIVGAYGYMDTMPPVWDTTVGAQTARNPLDCVRSVIVDWNQATDALSPPVKYEVYRFDCDPTPGAPQPCLNYFDFIPSSTNRVAITGELSFLDTAIPSSGSTDPQYLYIVRAIDSHSPINRELNYAKRHVIASKNTSDTTPPSPVGDTVEMPGGNLIDWGFASGALTYKLYRETIPSRYATPATLTALIQLTVANNDLDADGFVDTQYTDAAIPLPSQIFYYKVTALDPCNIETKNADLLP